MRKVLRFIPLVVASFIGALIGVKLQDSRIPVEDAVVGRDFRILLVDGKPVERRKHGAFVTVVPVALIEPGWRILTVEPRNKGTSMSKSATSFEFKAELLKGIDRYAVEADENGNPVLVVLKI